MLRGAELLLGSLLVTSGMLGTVTGPFSDEVNFEGRVQGMAEFDEAHAKGESWVEAESGAVDASGPVHLTGTVEEATVTVVRKSSYGARASVAERAFGAKVYPGPDRSQETYKNATIRFTGNAKGLLQAWPRSTGTSTFNLTLDPSRVSSIFASPVTQEVTSPDGEHAYRLAAPVFALGHRTSVYGDVPLAEDRFRDLHASGDLEVIVTNGTLTVETRRDTDAYRLNWSDAGKEDVEGQEVYADRKVEFARIVVEDANLRSSFGKASAAFLAHEPAWTVNGSLVLPTDEGQMHGEGVDEALENDTVELVGNTTLDLWAEGSDDGTEGLNGWSLPREVLPEPVVHATFESDSRQVAVNGEILSTTSSTPGAEEVTFLAKILGLVLLAWSVLKKGAFFLLGLLTDEVLDHPRREKIHAYLQQEGMAYLRQIQRATGMPLGSASYHLEIMREAGTVCSVRRNGYKIYFIPSERFSREEMERLALLVDPTRGQVARELAQDAPLSQREIADRVDISIGSVSMQLKKLVEDGLVRREGQRNSRYRPSSLLCSWLGSCRRGEA